MDEYNINLEDLLTCNPISKRGIDSLNRIKSELNVSMTINDFFSNGIYTQPYFEDELMAEKIFIPLSEYEEFEYYNSNAFSVHGSAIRNLQENKLNYERKVFSKNSGELLLIRAASGAGKTTYLNYLLWKRRKNLYPNTINDKIDYGKMNNACEINFDLERAVNSLLMGGIKFPNEDFYQRVKIVTGTITAPCSFLCMLMQSVFDLIYDIISSNDIATFKRIHKNFRIIYNDDYTDKTKALFNLMVFRPFIGKMNKRYIRATILKRLIDACLENDNTIELFINNTLRILTRLIVCNSDLKNPNQILISFDNIEHYIEIDKRIYDEDIRLISDSVYQFVTDEQKYYSKLEMNFAEFFKFVLVIRDTTEKMFSGNVHSYFYDHNYNSIDVTDWFSPNRIYFNKLKYFNLLNLNNTDIEFFNLIIDDNANTTGENVMQQISSMYNHNNRRVTRILARISKIFSQIKNQPDKNKACLNFEQFKDLWTNHNTNHVKYLCRQAVIRLIYNEISRTGYFRSIYGENMDFNEKSTYARRILTWLANNKNFEKEEYVSFHQIINEILKSPDVHNLSPNYEKIKDFANVLITLDEHRFTVSREDSYNRMPGPNRWCQLIVIKYNDSDLSFTLDEETLANKLYEEADNTYDANKYGIKITEAGYFLARALRDFEFFASRYDYNSVPLILMKNINEIKNTVDNIFNCSKKCIDNAIINEHEFFNGHFIDSTQFDLFHISNGKKIKYQTLPFRIIVQHRNYLQAYKSYIDNKELHNEFKVFTVEERENVSQYIQEYINKYNDLFYEIKHSNYVIGETKIENYFHRKSDNLV